MGTRASSAGSGADFPLVELGYGSQSGGGGDDAGVGGGGRTRGGRRCGTGHGE